MDNLYLVLDENSEGQGITGVIISGQSKCRRCVVLAAELFQNEEDAFSWFEKMIEEQPWEERLRETRH